MKIKSVVVGMALMMAAGSRAGSTNDLAGVLRNGLFEEQVNHDMNAAIATYQSVVTKFDTDRQLAATAAFRLGECYRTLGRTNEAVAQYQRVVNEFSDQATLVKLSQQNLVELRGRSALTPPTTNFNGRVQAIIERSRTQQSQEELARMQAAYAENQAILARLKDLNADQLKQQITTIGNPDPMLMNLMDQLNMAEQKLIMVKGEADTNHPNYKTMKQIVDDLQKKVADRMAGVLAARETALAVLKAQIEQLEKNASAMNPWEQAISNGNNSSQSQDKLAELRTEYAGKQAVLARLKDLNADQLKQQLLTIAPDQMLESLMEQLNMAEQQFLTIKGNTTPENPEYKNQKELVNDLQTKVTERMKGILASMDTELAGLNAQMEQLLKAEESAKQQQAAQSSRGTINPGVQLFQDLVSVSTDDEQQEIRRIQAMIQNSPDLINAAQGAQSTPLMTAAVKDELQVAQYLLDHGADVNTESVCQVNNRTMMGTPLHAAAENGHKKMVELLIGAGADVNARTKSTEATPLMCAANRGYPAVAEVLLAHGADPNLGDVSAERPLHYAVRNASTNLVMMLLAHGADVNATNSTGASPLYLAAGGDRTDLVTLLLENKAEVNARTQNGVTPLHVAADRHKSATVRLLLAHGAEINARDENDETPLLYALREDATASAKVLLEAKADPNLASNARTRGGRQYQGWTPLLYAVDHGNAELAEALLKAGAKPNVGTGNYIGYNNSWSVGRTPLIDAIDKKRADLVELLLRYKANPNLPDADGGEPLLQAMGKTNILDLLLEAGVDVNKPLKNHGTPLQWAVNGKSKGTVEVILAHHPDVNAIGGFGVTALDLTRGQNDMTEIAALLRAQGAVDNVPKYDRIQVSRPSAKYLATVFQKGTNDWNRYTLLELLAAHYGFISTSTSNVISEVYFDPDSVTALNSLKFPDLAGVKIWRPTASGGEAHMILVNVDEILESSDCARDMELKWGDMVEIPEVDHPIEAKWGGLTGEARTMLENCLKRSVDLKVKGQTMTFELKPKTFTGPTRTLGAYGRLMWLETRFSLWPVLSNSGLLRTASDLSRVKVTRTGLKTGKKQEWIVDCSDAQSPPDLWLRDGDVVEVPEK